MKTRISPNSIEAFQELNLSKRQEQVLRVIRETGTITAKGIAFALKLKINQVTGRVSELMHKQLIKVERVGKDFAGSNTNVNYYAIRKESDPKNLFADSWEDKYKKLDEWLREENFEMWHKFQALENHEL